MIKAYWYLYDSPATEYCTLIPNERVAGLSDEARDYAITMEIEKDFKKKVFWKKRYIEYET